MGLQSLLDILGWLFGGGRRPAPRPGPPPVRTTPPPVTTTSPPAQQDISTALLASHNALRQAAGVGPLTIDHRLATAAQAHADWMAVNRTLSHVGAGGSQPQQRIAAVGYMPSWSGENIADGYRSVPAVMAGWRGSPGHYANIINGHHQHVGFGVATDVAGLVYWCADFGAPISA